MVEATVRAKLPGKTAWEGLGRLQFRVMPRIGEHTQQIINEIVYASKVVAVHHPDTPAEAARDLFVVQVEERDDEVTRLFQQ
jgi:hypothetical protein